MKVLFLASYFPRPSKPMVGVWALEQAKALARTCDLRVACTTFYVPGVLRVLPKARPWIDVPATYQWDNVPIHYLKGLYYPVSILKRWAHRAPQRQMALAWRSVRRRVFWIVEEFRPDVIFCHHTAVNGYFASQIKAAYGLPFVVTDHDFTEISDCRTLPRRRAFFEPIKRQAFANVCVSTRMEKDTRELFPDAKVLTVHNGINPLPAAIFTTPRPAELRNRKVVFSAGMFAPRKGFPLLVDAFKIVSQKHSDAVLRIAGDGEQRPEIEAAIVRNGLGDKVTLLGLQPPARVYQEAAWSDLFALISWDEPFGVVFVEAMGAGKPVIAASDCGITDVVRDGVHGLWVPPKDVSAAAAAIDRLLSNDSERLQMGLRAQALVRERLTWDANAQRFVALFSEAAAAARQSA